MMASVEGASVLIDDVDTSLGILDLKLKHMRADITAIEARNNSLQVRQACHQELVIDTLRTMLQAREICNATMLAVR